MIYEHKMEMETSFEKMVKIFVERQRPAGYEHSFGNSVSEPGLGVNPAPAPFPDRSSKALPVGLWEETGLAVGYSLMRLRANLDADTREISAGGLTGGEGGDKCGAAWTTRLPTSAECGCRPCTKEVR